MEVDIYGDIENFDFGEQLEKVRHENNDLRNTIQQLEKTLDDFSKELARLKSANANLEFNISALYGTAKAEFERKNKQLSQLRKDFDSLFKRKKENIASNRILQQNEELQQEIERDKQTINIKMRIITSLTNELDNLKKQLGEKNGSKRDGSHLNLDEDPQNNKRQKLQNPEVENKNEIRSNKERSYRSRSPDHFKGRGKYFKSGFDSRNKFRYSDSFKRSNFLRYKHGLPSKYPRSSRSRSRTPIMGDSKYKSPKKRHERRKSLSLNKDVETKCISTEIRTTDKDIKDYEEKLKTYKRNFFQSEKNTGEAKSNTAKEIINDVLEVISSGEEETYQFENKDLCAKFLDKGIHKVQPKGIEDDLYPSSEPEDGELDTSFVEEENSPEKGSINNNNFHRKENAILEKNRLNDNEICNENKITNIEKRKDVSITDTNYQKLNKDTNKVEKCQKRNIIEKKKDDSLENKLILNNNEIRQEVKKVENCQKSNLTEKKKVVLLENKSILNNTPSSSKDSKKSDNLQLEKKEIKTNKNVDATREKKHSQFDNKYKIPKRETKSENSGSDKEIKLTNKIITKNGEKEKQTNKIDKSNKLNEKLFDLFEEQEKYETTGSSNKKKEDQVEIKVKSEKFTETEFMKNKPVLENNVELLKKDKKLKKDDDLSQTEDNVELKDMEITKLKKKINVLTSEISKLDKLKEEEKVKKSSIVHEDIRKTKMRRGLGTGKPSSFLKLAKEYEKHKIVFSPQTASFQKLLNESSSAETSVEETVQSSAAETTVEETIQSTAAETTIEETVKSSAAETTVEETVQSSAAETTVEETVQSFAADTTVEETVQSSAAETTVDENVQSSAAETTVEETVQSSAALSTLEEKLPNIPDITAEATTIIPANKSFESSVISLTESVLTTVVAPVIQETTDVSLLNKSSENNNTSVRKSPLRGRRRRRCVITITKKT